MQAQPEPITDVAGARVLAVLETASRQTTSRRRDRSGRRARPGSSCRATAWPVPTSTSYGAGRGNHEVMIRGTFANPRIRNHLVPGTEGGVTVHLPDGEQTTIFEAAVRYQSEAVPLVVIAGKEYGSGSHVTGLRKALRCWASAP